MNFRIAYLVIGLISCGCIRQGNDDPGKLIEIRSLPDKEISSDGFVSFNSMISLADSSIVIGNVEDICQIEKRLYVLDDVNVIYSIEIEDGRISGAIHRVGSGPGEYVMPKALSVWQDRLCVLDMALRSIIVYDKEFNYIKTIKINIPSINFAAGDDFFALENLDIAADNHRLVMVDTLGSKQASLLPANKNDREYLPAKLSFVNVADDLAVLSPRDRTIFRIEGKKLRPLVTFDFGAGNMPAEMVCDASNYMDYVLPTDYFELDGRNVLSILSQGRRYYSFIDQDGNCVTTGTLPDVFGYSFFPRWQLTDKTLVGYDDELISEDGTTNEGLLLFR